MLSNLSNELRRKGISQNTVAKLLNCTDRTLTNKLSGATEFSISEALSIWKNLLPEFTIDYLFKDSGGGAR